ncbi:hypothetical protein GCM10011572_53690 [Pseudoduganella buxea]|uniref:Uncharacterized protein n=1 Tax=Pseudoduganella buxea TaxID=1949069 RepID=A0ABQ1LLH4_9BURK|nr:hypothetical protein GCM10011572_53690 [Pseudoduganella buxea]
MLKDVTAASSRAGDVTGTPHPPAAPANNNEEQMVSATQTYLAPGPVALAEREARLVQLRRRA